MSKEKVFPEGWLVYNEKVMTSGIFLRDATHVTDHALLLFGGELESAGQGTIGMLDGYLSFSAPDDVKSLIKSLRAKLDDLLLMKIENPNIHVAEEGKILVDAALALLRSNSTNMQQFNNMNMGDDGYQQQGYHEYNNYHSSGDQAYY